MKKIIIAIIIIMGIFVCNRKADKVMIPYEAIRFRIVANSNSNIDQANKLIVRDKLEKEIVNDLSKTNNITEARNTIKSNINNYEKIVKTTLKENNIDTNFTINYGYNYFPEKEYKGVKYNSGDYESVVVTLGDGIGKNWWCVLFPPLCLLEAEENQTEEVEYKFFVKEIVEKYFK